MTAVLLLYLEKKEKNFDCNQQYKIYRAKYSITNTIRIRE